jgi:hypothetical protein
MKTKLYNNGLGLSSDLKDKNENKNAKSETIIPGIK